MVFAPVTFGGIKPGALLTGLPTQAASNEITNRLATAEKMKLLTESAKVRAGRMKLFMDTTSPRFALVEQPVDERRGGDELAAVFAFPDGLEARCRPLRRALARL